MGTYELVREGMISKFFKSLVDNPRFGRLYFCSPWINPSETEAAILRYACLQTQRRGVQCDVLVITRPPEMMPPGMEGGLDCFKDVGAKILFHPRLHSKLYIREPDANGGHSIAIVGSQNLTRSTHLELGIRINDDSRMIDELIRYFLHLAAQSSDE